MIRLLQGDCREVLATLPAESVQCCVSSPPYYGLRSYLPDGHADKAREIGLETTPADFVARLVEVFREVRRVLRPDGTCWVNMGDAYCSGTAAPRKATTTTGAAVPASWAGRCQSPRIPAGNGLKPKDLMGIPWAVARALQAPYYIGRIKDEADRAYLAGFIDGEGTISFVERYRGQNTPTHDVRVFVTNTDEGLLRHFCDLTAGRVYQHESGDRDNRFGSRPCFRWQMGTHDSARLIRELFPYLRGKKKQAALIWTLYGTLRHRNGHARTPAAVVEMRRAIADMVRALNRGEAVDLPDWVEEPPPATEPGWYLRSDVIWAKPNPMPESIRDRPTKSHEYLFLLTKADRYFYDAKAISEPLQTDPKENYPARARATGRGTQSYTTAHNGSPSQDRSGGFPPSDDLMRNARSVWTIATEAFAEAHFATFPTELARRCILAGTRPGDTVLDPFAGAGTTLLVADREKRDGIGIELSPEYIEIARRRISGDAPLLAEVA